MFYSRRLPPPDKSGTRGDSGTQYVANYEIDSSTSVLDILNKIHVGSSSTVGVSSTTPSSSKGTTSEFLKTDVLYTANLTHGVIIEQTLPKTPKNDETTTKPPLTSGPGRESGTQKYKINSSTSHLDILNKSHVGLGNTHISNVPRI